MCDSKNNVCITDANKITTLLKYIYFTMYNIQGSVELSNSDNLRDDPVTNKDMFHS